MSEMRDRIEAALREAMGGQGHVNYPGVARHLLAATREPTEAMVRAGRGPHPDRDPVDVWHDMVDEALK